MWAHEVKINYKFLSTLYENIFLSSANATKGKQKSWKMFPSCLKVYNQNYIRKTQKRKKNEKSFNLARHVGKALETGWESWKFSSLALYLSRFVYVSL